MQLDRSYFFFQNISTITIKKEAVKPENEFKDIAFRLLFENFKLLIWAVKLQTFTYCWTKDHQPAVQLMKVRML